jgi:hypothetical protein
VTRLGEFSTIGRLFVYFGQFFNCKRSPKIWATFFPGKINLIILAPMGLGFSLGDFFTNSSGHPVCNRQFEEVAEKKLLFVVVNFRNKSTASGEMGRTELKKKLFETFAEKCL